MPQQSIRYFARIPYFWWEGFRAMDPKLHSSLHIGNETAL